ncbi:MAG: BolA family transcriptional regulator [Gammaproteobacteria bacterium]|nr:BolA family transcriptional regulator [Gammaproteobacteria bacterium]
MTTRLERMQTLLTQTFEPTFLNLIDESYMHQVPAGSESHFKLTLVSSQFADLKQVARHRLVNSAVTPERQQGLHALSLALFTPDEWAQQPNVQASPLCQGKKKS